MKNNWWKKAGNGMAFFVFVLISSIFAGGFQSEDEVKMRLKDFQKAVETGDDKLAESLVSKSFIGNFISLYQVLSKAYVENKMAFPLEIGQVKILGNGRAKAETWLNPGRDLFVFTFLREEGQWRICHFECIRFPVYSISATPCKNIYQIPADNVKWMIAEKDLNFINLVYDKLKRDQGEKAAEAFFSDGPGFQVAMDAWLPFIEGAAQFAVFYSILEENYYGSSCTIQKAGEEEAEVRCAPLQFLEVYVRSFATPRMPLDQFQRLYETIMQNRAASCGLELQITYEKSNCLIKVKKKEVGKKKT